MQFSPLSVFLPFRSKYLPQHSVHKNPQSVLNDGIKLLNTETKDIKNGYTGDLVEHIGLFFHKVTSLFALDQD
jgi:hypothetical protein